MTFYTRSVTMTQRQGRATTLTGLSSARKYSWRGLSEQTAC